MRTRLERYLLIGPVVMLLPAWFEANRETDILGIATVVACWVFLWIWAWQGEKK